MTMTAAFNTMTYALSSSSDASGITVANVGYKYEIVCWRLRGDSAL